MRAFSALTPMPRQRAPSLRSFLAAMSEVEGLWGEAKRFFRQLASKGGSGSGEDYGGEDYGDGDGGSDGDGDGDGDIKSLVGDLSDNGPQVGASSRGARQRDTLLPCT